MDKFPECESCMNKELDPFQCDDCEDACNFEPYEEEEDASVEEMSIQEFVEFWRNGQ
jgi:hypothetical protein